MTGGTYVFSNPTNAVRLGGGLGTYEVKNNVSETS